MASTSLRDLPTDEYFPATNAFLRSLAEPEPQRPPTASVRSRSAAASENWRVADPTERAATERAERAYRALEKNEGAAKASKRRKAKKAKAPVPAPPADAASPPETDTYGMYQPRTTPPHKAFQERQMSTLQLEAPGGVAGCFERAGWMCCVEDNRTSSCKAACHRSVRPSESSASATNPSLSVVLSLTFSRNKWASSRVWTGISLSAAWNRSLPCGRVEVLLSSTQHIHPALSKHPATPPGASSCSVDICRS